MKKLMFAVALMQVIDLAAVELPPFRETPFDPSFFYSPWRRGRSYENMIIDACRDAGIDHPSSSGSFLGKLERGRRQDYFLCWDLWGDAWLRYDELGRLVSLCAFEDTEYGRAITNRLERERMKACDKLASKFNLSRLEMEKKYEEIENQKLEKLKKEQELSRSSVGRSHDGDRKFADNPLKRDQQGLLEPNWCDSPWCIILNKDLQKTLRDIESNEAERCGSVLADSGARQTPSWFRMSGKNLIDMMLDRTHVDVCCKFGQSGRLIYAGPFKLTEEAQKGYAARDAFVASNRLEWAKERGMTVDEAEKGYKAFVKRERRVRVPLNRECGCFTIVQLDPDYEFEMKLKKSQDRHAKAKSYGMSVDLLEWDSSPWARAKGVEFLLALSNVCERSKVTYVGPVIDMEYQDVAVASNFCQKAGGLLRYVEGASWTNRCGRSLLVAEEQGGPFGMEGCMMVLRYDSDGCLVWRGRLDHTKEWRAIEEDWNERMAKAKSAWAKNHGLTTAMCDWISRVGYDRWSFETKTHEFVDKTNDVNSVFGVQFPGDLCENHSHSMLWRRPMEHLSPPVKWFCSRPVVGVRRTSRRRASRFSSTPRVGMRRRAFQTLEFRGYLPKDMTRKEIDRNVAKLKQLLTAKWKTPQFVENEEALYRCGKPLAVCISVNDGKGGDVREVKLTIAKNDRIAKQRMKVGKDEN